LISQEHKILDFTAKSYLEVKSSTHHMFAILNSERRKNTKRHEVGEDTNGASMSTSHTLILSSLFLQREHKKLNIYIYDDHSFLDSDL
jgi:hypothetical protein